ncbi:MAG: hypothetical protein WC728_13050 [Elusimicrobiota bacterium]
MANKVENLLAVLRGETPPEEVPQAEAPAPAPAAQGAAVSEGELAQLKDKIAELEQKLEGMAAPPPMEMAAPPPLEEQPEPPQPPTELAVFLQTKVQLMEKRLELAQQEALRANILLREREEAQRKAQKEVEDLFRSIRESQRAATWDRALHGQYAQTQSQVQDLQLRLQTAQLKMLPAEEVLRFMQTEEGRVELEKRIKAQLEAPIPPAPPQIGLEKTEPPAMKGPLGLEPPPGLETLSVLTARIADLEHQLEESEAARRKEAEQRRRWEEDILLALKQTRRQWQKGGGPELLVEASLESMVDCLKERDSVRDAMTKAVDALRDEAPDSPQVPALRARLAECRQKMELLQEKLDKQMALVQAWVERNKGPATES